MRFESSFEFHTGFELVTAWATRFSNSSIFR